MNVQKAWLDYYHQNLTSAGASDVIKCRRAFFAGVAALFEITGTPLPQYAQVVADLADEIDSFRDLVRTGVA